MFGFCDPPLLSLNENPVGKEAIISEGENERAKGNRKENERG